MRVVIVKLWILVMDAVVQSAVMFLPEKQDAVTTVILIVSIMMDKIVLITIAQPLPVHVVPLLAILTHPVAHTMIPIFQHNILCSYL